MEETKSKKLLRLKQVLERVPVGRSTLYNWVKTGRFPKPIQIGTRCAVWHEEYIDNWIEEKKEKRSVNE